MLKALKSKLTQAKEDWTYQKDQADWYLKDTKKFTPLEKWKNLYNLTAGDFLDCQNSYGETVLQLTYGSLGSLSSKLRLENSPERVLIFRSDLTPTEAGEHVFELLSNLLILTKRAKRRIVRGLIYRAMSGNLERFPWGEFFVSEGAFFIQLKNPYAKNRLKPFPPVRALKIKDGRIIE